MPFYTFITEDEDVDSQEFLIKLSFSEYDDLKTNSQNINANGFFFGDNGPVHPKTNLSVKTWKRIVDNVSVAFEQPWESSKWDNFEYRAGYNMMKAKKHREDAEVKSHMGKQPIQDYERAMIGDASFDLGATDIDSYEGKIE